MKSFLAGSIAFALMATGSAAYGQANTNHAHDQPSSGGERRAPAAAASHPAARGEPPRQAMSAGGASPGVRPQAHQSSAAEARPRPEDASAGESRPGFDPRGHDIEVSRQYHNGAYRHPQGYEDRRWGHGDHLPPQYYGHEYWIEDFAAFGLFEPPPYMIWIRVGNDALLIDEDSGEIIQVAREVFY